MTSTLHFFLLSTLVCLLGSTYADVAKSGAPTSGRSELLFSLAGSNTIGERLAPAWAEAFLASEGASNIRREALAKDNEYRVLGAFEHDEVHIEIRAHGSTTGFSSLQDGSADIAMSSRAIKPNELVALAPLGDLSSAAGEHVVAVDGLAVIVHPQNPISALNLHTLALIFSGKISNWKTLGGRDQEISIYARDDNSGTWDTFKALVLKESNSLVTGAHRFESNDDLSASVAADAGAIGFVGLASVNSSKPLAVFDGATEPLTPLPLHVATEDYPLARRLFLYTSTEPTKWVEEFVQFVHSPTGQEVVEKIGFVAQNPLQLPVENPAGPAFYREMSRHAERLSMNFRFQPNSAELDNKAKRDIQRVADYLKQPQNRSLRVQLVGFSDEEKTGSLAHILSKMRATAVKTELFHHGINTEAVMGFGANKPVAQAAEARTKNDRVEVWLYTDEKDEMLEDLRRQALGGEEHNQAPKVSNQ